MKNAFNEREMINEDGSLLEDQRRVFAFPISLCSYRESREIRARMIEPDVTVLFYRTIDTLSEGQGMNIIETSAERLQNCERTNKFAHCGERGA